MNDTAHLWARTHAFQRRVDQALDRLAGWAADHGPPSHVALSGGKDSVVVAHLVRTLWPDTPLVTFDSGLEFPETLPFIGDLCDHLGWVDWFILRANPTALEWFTAAGTWDINAPAGDVPCSLQEALIDGPSRAARQAFGDSVAWGLRAEESRGRAITLRQSRGLRQRADGLLTMAPIWDWSTRDVWAFHARHDLPRNPVYDRLKAMGVPERDQRVSLMIEGHAVTTGRLMWLRRGWPEEFARLAQQLPDITKFA